jgi:Zn-dependent M28 family amino/carboxypeptidase
MVIGGHMSADISSRRPQVVAESVLGALAVAGSVLLAAPAAATPAQHADCAASPGALAECVTLDGVREHMRTFQDIADAHGGNRAAGTPGYDASAEYVADRARAAGLAVSMQEFEFTFFELRSESLQRTDPAPAMFVADTDFATMRLSAGGDVTAQVVPVDVLLPATGGSTSGCEPADFTGFPVGAVALMQRGTCEFRLKVANATAAGAAAAVIFNEGNAPDRVELLQGSVGAPADIPVMGTTFALGEALQNATVRVRVDAASDASTTTNVLAEKAGSSDRVLMVGAHLDSVPQGPGINDNGSGSAAILEVAEQIAGATPTATVRFAWWSAEELGLVGSDHYMATLPAPERARIAGYLNFDMVGSPNPVRFVYDGDDSDAAGEGPGPAGSAAIEDVFEKFYADRGLGYEGTDFDGRSDYGPFIEADIPAGGLFTGAEGIKTPEQAAAFGGQAGAPYDACYHQACDTIANLDDAVLDVNADAIANATFVLAADPGLIAAPPAPPAAPDDGGTGGSGLSHDHGRARS